MSWTIIDLLIVLCMPIFALNLIIIVIVCLRRILEERLSMIQLDKLLKKILIYFTISIPLIILYAIYKIFYHEYLLFESNGLHSMYLVEYFTFSDITELIWYPIFIVSIIVWIVGIVVSGVLRFIKENNFLKRLESFSKKSTDTDVSDLLKQFTEKEQIKQEVHTFINSVIVSPFIIGLKKAKIFLPDRNFSYKEKQLILKHELNHLKQKDYLYRRLLFFISSLYWFNPAIHTMSEFFITINEMACDEEVIKSCSKEDKLLYAKLICDMANAHEDIKYDNIMHLTGEIKSDIERRLINMRKKISMKKLPYSIISTMLLLICPISSYAATNATLELQDFTVRSTFKEDSSKQMQLQEKTLSGNELIVFERTKVEYFNMSKLKQGSLDIDMDLKYKKRITGDTFELSKGDKIVIYLTADNSNDKFRAGISGTSNTYVNSKNGEIFHIFTIKKSGKYKVYMEATQKVEVHVTGSIYLDN